MDDGRIDELYGLPPEDFTAARTKLVKELKEAGDKVGAATVQALRKPTVAAWTVNQLARSSGKDIEELLAVGSELREAQKKALSGGGAKGLQEAGARRRQLVDRLVQAAGRILEKAGSSPTRAHLDEVANSLMAATVDDQAAEVVRRGRLEKELPPPAGFGELGDLATVIPMPKRPKPEAAPASKGPPAKVQTAADARARKRAEALAQEAEAAEAEAGRLAEEADRAESDALRLQDEADRAQRTAARARREAERAGKRAAGIRSRADTAAERSGT
jgi:hypothetical protein